MLPFELSVRQSVLTQKSDYLLLGLASKNGKPIMTPAVKAIDRAVGGLISTVVKNGYFKAKTGDTLLLHGRGWPFSRLMLVGAEKDGRGWVQALSNLDKGETVSISCALQDENAFMRLAYAAAESCYEYKQGGHSPAMKRRKRFCVFAEGGFSGHTATRLRALARRAGAFIEGLCLVRHLAEQPGNVCGPDFLSAVARDMAKKSKIKTTVLTEKEMCKLKMNALLAVGKGSRKPPRLIVLEYKGGDKGACPVVLVGKGVTFDSGGISIKPAATMDEMKFDMCGAAAVLGAISACDGMKLPLNVTGIVPACENMPDGDALKPGDVITAMNGKTVEVLNTDAEGRLILADALSYAARHKPAAVVDIATLTGACVIALGRHNSGLMSTNDALAAELQTAGASLGDTCWRLPLGEEYQKQLKSDYADMANIGGRGAGTITAACFLSQFVECPAWAHLDIAGTSVGRKKTRHRPAFAVITKFSDAPG